MKALSPTTLKIMSLKMSNITSLFTQGRWIVALTLAALSLAPIAARASLVLENSSFGANTLVLDTSTGSTWLSLNVTQGQSLNQVVSELTTTYTGFSVATLPQIDAFANDAGVTTNGGVVAGSNANLVTFLNAWGVTENVSTGTESVILSLAQTADTNSSFPGYVANAVFESWSCTSGCNPNIGWLAITTNNNLQQPNTSSPYLSVALVEAAPVPLPAAAWLLLSGLFGVGVMARKRRTA
jgi:hypothetical protein